MELLVEIAKATGQLYYSAQDWANQARADTKEATDSVAVFTAWHRKVPAAQLERRSATQSCRLLWRSAHSQRLGSEHAGRRRVRCRLLRSAKRTAQEGASCSVEAQVGDSILQAALAERTFPAARI